MVVAQPKNVLQTSFEMYRHFHKNYIFISPHFASTSSNRNWGSQELQPSKWYWCVEEKILFHVESHIFTGKEFNNKWRLHKFSWLKPICFSKYLKQFLQLWNIQFYVHYPHARLPNRKQDKLKGWCFFSWHSIKDPFKIQVLTAK